MHFNLMNNENMIAAFALVLIIIFALAAFLDNRWRKVEPHRGFGFNPNPNFLPQRDDSDDQDSTSNLYLHYADLSAIGLGTAERQITSRAETQQNLEED